MDFQNILIFRIGHLGDTVVALPALWAIRRRFPLARLTLLTNIDQRNPHYVSPVDVLPRAGLIDEVLPYPTNLGYIGSMRAHLGLARKLRQGHFDAAIYLMPRVRTIKQIERDRIFFRLAGINSLLGSDFLKRERLEIPALFPTPEIERESDFLLRMLAEAGISSDLIETDLLLTEEEILAADSWFARASSNMGEEILVGVAPGSKLKSKMWSEERYVEVLAGLIENFDCHPIIFGGREDRKKADRMISALGCGSNAAGELNIRESAVLLRKCKMYLGNDTGTMHLSAAVGVPCVAIFAPIDWAGRWAPFGDNNRLFHGPLKDNSGAGSHDRHRSLDLVEVLEVYDACADVLTNT